jgi:hypothetical protein
MAVAVALLFTQRPASISGAVIAESADPSRQIPIADVEVTAVGGPPAGPVHSDASGYFNIPLSWRIRRSVRIMLHFRHPDYHPADLPDTAGDRLLIAHLTPLVRASTTRRPVTIANVIAKYSVSTTTTVNIGGAVKTFQVVNVGNVACNGRRPCSPDGKWKAAIGSATLDAGLDNEFRNARASCIAGPCPFTRIENEIRDASPDGSLKVSALNWSDTATFLFEADVYRRAVNDVLRQSYPLIFDGALTFTLPAAAEGLSLEAELNGDAIVFPLGPTLFLSWANCQSFVNKDQSKLYRCELKPGYRFL